MMSLWDALRMNMMISYQELVRTFPKRPASSLMKSPIFTASSKISLCVSALSVPHWFVLFLFAMMFPLCRPPCC